MAIFIHPTRVPRKWPASPVKTGWSKQYGNENLKLIYNDNHNTLAGMSHPKESIQLFKTLKHEGIPTDGIGIQCHTKITIDGQHRGCPRC
ncbi:endo-1,4-beta-xylanase [Pontiella agarivorans]|uniref:endo-1,4-beta-xylanase n=1 Tax=Pontiella agarivorans TaxID=3038953 RepID=UPI002AD29817|nr:endo-1,4-beta-xylanase [Pontiella agarivorans]